MGAILLYRLQDYHCLQENRRLTEVGISLHKQGRVIDKLFRERFKTRIEELEEVFEENIEYSVSEGVLDMVKRNLQKGEVLKQIIDGLEPIKQLLKYQEDFLKYK